MNVSTMRLSGSVAPRTSLRVLIISNMYPSSADPGYGIYVRDQVEELRKRGIAVELLATDRKPTTVVQRAAKYLEHFGNALRHCRNDYDMVHLHFPAPPHLLAAAPVLLLSGVPFVVTIHRGELHDLPRRGLQPWLVSSFLRRAYKTIAVSRELAEDAALRFGLPEDRLEVINVGYNGDIFRPCDPAERAAARKRAGFHEDRFTVLFIGTLEPRKGLETLLEALEGLGAEMPVELCVVGIGPSEAALKALANRHRLRDHIHWLGARPHDDLWELYAAADAFVLPSYREGTPTVMLEAMASGTPVVLTDVGGVPDVVRHEQNGLLFRPGDVGACRAMIERVVRDSSLARRISRQALEDIQEHSLSRQVERIEAIYRSGSALRRFRTQRR